MQNNFLIIQTCYLSRMSPTQQVQPQKNHILYQEKYISIFHESKFNFRKSKICEKYHNKFTKSSIYFYKNISGVQNWVKTKPLRDSFISSISKLFFNSNKVLNTYLRCLNIIQLLEKINNILNRSNRILFSSVQ